MHGLRPGNGALALLLLMSGARAGAQTAECRAEAVAGPEWRAAYERTLQYAAAAGPGRTVAANQIPRRTFVDEEIFGRLEKEGMSAAALSSDEEFYRRIHLDLAGQLPTAAAIKAFVADPNPGKRDAIIDKLLYSPGYIDKWTLWLGDLFQNAATAQNRSQQIEGRNRMHEYLQQVVGKNQSWRDTAWQLLNATGNNYDRTTPGVNYILRGYAPGGPAQDSYDLLLVKSATTFLGLGHYDCLLCHNGKRHMETISSWGARSLKIDAQRMAAHFARVSMSTYPKDGPEPFYVNSTTVLNRASGGYDLNTNYGNRPNRVAVTVDGKTVASLTPVYRDGVAASGDWRDALADAMVKDPMFARNFVNRIWKQLFGLGLAEPVDFLDPDRLDPAHPPAEPWTLQASHPELLEKLAGFVRENDYDLRETIRFLVSSNAYQLSARYGGAWDLTKAPLQARHLARRLDAEEVHDAIVKATGVTPSYAVGGYVDPVKLAIQMPDASEPRSNSTALSFLASFNRGNRDTVPRSQTGSSIMWLNLMNSSFVTSRVKASGTGASPVLTALAANGSNEAVVEELFLGFLSRRPTEAEKKVALAALGKSGSAGYTRAAAVEDLAWALINKIDFLYSY